jgi:hypothetical protein
VKKALDKATKHSKAAGVKKPAAVQVDKNAVMIQKSTVVVSCMACLPGPVPGFLCMAWCRPVSR